MAEFVFKNGINLVQAIIFILVFKIILTCINLYTSQKSSKKISIAEIKTGDSLDKSKLALMDKNQEIAKSLGKIRPEGLESFQIDILKKHFVAKKEQFIFIHKTIPFSIWILIGIVLTVIFKGIIRFAY